jgi:PAS domain S-box-containing protein
MNFTPLGAGRSLSDTDVLNGILKISSEAIIVADQATRILLFSAGAEANFGYTADEILGQPIERLIPTRFRAMHKQHVDQFASAPAKSKVMGERNQLVGLRKSGEEFPAEASLSKHQTPDGLLFTTIVRDITEHWRAETALAESEAKYRALADNVTDIILLFGPDGLIRYVSPACRSLGLEPEGQIGQPITNFIAPEQREYLPAILGVLFSGAELDSTSRRLYKLLDQSGHDVWFESNPRLMRDEAGDVREVVSVLRDVTKTLAMEEELRCKRAEAETATMAKGEFLANMSHEIRTPLTGIVGFAGLLEKMDGLPEQARTYARRIITGSQALLSVVNDVLDFSKIEARQIELDPQPFDPKAFVEETVELLRAQARAKGLALSVEASGALPAAVRADSGRARQVLLNLLGNAIKFTASGAVTVKVSYLADSGARLRIAVSDTGVGIPAERADRLFQRFSQVDGSIARRYGGTGLGLAICKSLTELMGGEIGVDSEIGRGSTFWFTIAAPTATLEAPAAADEAGDWTVGPARILVVDDTAVNRELVSALLSPFDVHLTEAASGAEAVNAALITAFDLILMDMQMPGMDGLAATRAIRATAELNRATPIVALSANVLPAQVAACHEAGMDDHIAKPIDPDELLGKIALWIHAPTRRVSPSLGCTPAS